MSFQTIRKFIGVFSSIVKYTPDNAHLSKQVNICNTSTMFILHVAFHFEIKLF